MATRNAIEICQSISKEDLQAQVNPLVADGYDVVNCQMFTMHGQITYFAMLKDNKPAQPAKAPKKKPATKETTKAPASKG